MTFSDVCNKEVIQVESGVCLGKIDDLIMDPNTAEILAFVMLGRPKLFGILGREEALQVPFDDVMKFGIDAILIKTALPVQPNKKNKSFVQALKEIF